MVFEQDRRLEQSRHEVQLFVQQALKPGVLIGKQRETVIKQFCEVQQLSPEFARGLNHLVTKFDRVKSAADMADLLNFALWLKDKVGNFYGKGSMVYLADQKTKLKDMLESMKVNYDYWTSIFGKKLFVPQAVEHEAGGAIWKSWMPLEGYYMMARGGSGAGTFSVDISIGYDERDDRKTQQDTRGQIWRVGVDVERAQDGENIFRIIRTGSGHKSQGVPERLEQLKGVRSDFLDEYQVSPQRLLLFVALEMAYTLGFDKVKGLSTQGAMELSLLRRAKKPPDYTASMVDVGFTERPGNWHEISNLQERFFDIFASYWHEQNRQDQGRKINPNYDVHGYTAALNAFNELTDLEGNGIDLKLADNPADLEKAWRAFHQIHSKRRAHGNLRDALKHRRGTRD